MNKILFEGVDSLTLKEKAIEELKAKIGIDDIYLSKDVLILEPQDGKIVVEQAMAITEFLSYKPVFAAERGVIILDMHLSNENFQDAILKILEDSNACIVITATEHNMLPTIYSRVEVHSELTKTECTKLADDVVAAVICRDRRKVFELFGLLLEETKSLFESNPAMAMDTVKCIQAELYKKRVPKAFEKGKLCELFYKELKNKRASKVSYFAFLKELSE